MNVLLRIDLIGLFGDGNIYFWRYTLLTNDILMLIVKDQSVDIQLRSLTVYWIPPIKRTWHILMDVFIWMNEWMNEWSIPD